jgi:protein TonB
VHNPYRRPPGFGQRFPLKTFDREVRFLSERTKQVSSYRGSADRPDQARAIAAVVAVHVALATVILTGLNVEIARRTVEQLTTIDIREPPPPPRVPPPPPTSKPQRMKKPAGAPAPKAEPTPVAAPESQIPEPSPIPAATVAGIGSASTSGASTSGTGTAAGGSGNGTGGGGSGNFAGYSPPGLLQNLGRHDYRTLAAGRLPIGSAVVSLMVEPTGLPSNCVISRSSGDAYVDQGLCPLILQRLRFRPALDNLGRPIPYRLQYVATWRI